MNPKFTDYSPHEFKRHAEAAEQWTRLRLARTSSVDEEDREAARLVTEFGYATDGTSLILARVGCDPTHRAFVDAVIGLYRLKEDEADANGFVEFNDQVLAKRAGRSLRWVQDARNAFREWRDHSILIEIKDNWRDPDTGESHAHAYRVHVDELGVETVLAAQASPEWKRDKCRAMLAAKLQALTEATGLPLSTLNIDIKRVENDQPAALDEAAPEVAETLGVVANFATTPSSEINNLRPSASDNTHICYYPPDRSEEPTHLVDAPPMNIEPEPELGPHETQSFDSPSPPEPSTADPPLPDVLPEKADDEARVNAVWDLMQRGQLEDAQSVVSLIEDALTRKLIRARLQRASERPARE